MIVMSSSMVAMMPRRIRFIQSLTFYNNIWACLPSPQVGERGAEYLVQFRDRQETHACKIEVETCIVEAMQAH